MADRLTEVRAGIVRRAKKTLAVGSGFLFSAMIAAAQSQTALEVSNRQFVVEGPGEIEVAVSWDGQQVVVAVNGVGKLDVPPVRNRIFWLDDDHFVSAGGGNLPKVMWKSRDPSVAWTGTGTFYLATMGSQRDGLIASSTNGGHSFTLTDPAMKSDSTKRPARCIPAGRCGSDQPHIAGDRRPNQDQVYIAWRNKVDDGNYFSMVGCSTDGGKHWLRRSVERYLPMSQRRGDFPRLTVAPDGFVYVISATSRTNGDLLLQRFSPCSSGFEPRWTDSAGHSAPSQIGHFTGVKCESSIFGTNTIAGLDRCNVGNILASPTIAVDETNAHRVFVVYADETTQGNHDIVVLSTDDVTQLSRNEEFPNRQTLNYEWRGERYLPWACATQGRVYAGWYDRRSKTSRHNDNTEYFVGASDARDAEVSEAIDRQCASGWPGGGGQNEARACSQQPQLAGFCLPCQPGSQGCSAKPKASTPRCDLSTGGCAAGLNCVPPANNKGVGKFGDYNGIACTQGSAYVAWASATEPSSLPPVAGLSVFFARVDPVSLPARTPPSPECQDCRADHDSCVSGDPSDTRFCAQIYSACRHKHGCR